MNQVNQTEKIKGILSKPKSILNTGSKKDTKNQRKVSWGNNLINNVEIEVEKKNQNLNDIEEVSYSKEDLSSIVDFTNKKDILNNYKFNNLIENNFNNIDIQNKEKKEIQAPNNNEKNNRITILNSDFNNFYGENKIENVIEFEKESTNKKIDVKVIKIIENKEKNIQDEKKNNFLDIISNFINKNISNNNDNNKQQINENEIQNLNINNIYNNNNKNNYNNNNNNNNKRITLLENIMNLNKFVEQNNDNDNNNNNTNNYNNNTNNYNNNNNNNTNNKNTNNKNNTNTNNNTDFNKRITLTEQNIQDLTNNRISLETSTNNLNISQNIETPNVFDKNNNQRITLLNQNLTLLNDSQFNNQNNRITISQPDMLNSIFNKENIPFDTLNNNLLNINKKFSIGNSINYNNINNLPNNSLSPISEKIKIINKSAKKFSIPNSLINDIDIENPLSNSQKESLTTDKKNSQNKKSYFEERMLYSPIPKSHLNSTTVIKYNEVNKTNNNNDKNITIDDKIKNQLQFLNNLLDEKKRNIEELNNEKNNIKENIDFIEKKEKEINEQFESNTQEKIMYQEKNEKLRNYIQKIEFMNNLFGIQLLIKGYFEENESWNPKINDNIINNENIETFVLQISFRAQIKVTVSNNLFIENNTDNIIVYNINTKILKKHLNSNEPLLEKGNKFYILIQTIYYNLVNEFLCPKGINKINYNNWKPNMKNVLKYTASYINCINLLDSIFSFGENIDLNYLKEKNLIKVKFDVLNKNGFYIKFLFQINLLDSFLGIDLIEAIFQNEILEGKKISYYENKVQDYKISIKNFLKNSNKLLFHNFFLLLYDEVSEF